MMIIVHGADDDTGNIGPEGGCGDVGDDDDGDGEHTMTRLMAGRVVVDVDVEVGVGVGPRDCV